MKIDRKVRLRVEALEGRVLPSTSPLAPPAPYAGWGSTNWSGIDLDTKNGAASAVSASWTVPAVPTISPVQYSSTWVGIDGDLSRTVEQIGTEADTATSPLIPNAPPYFAWYEMYPSGMNVITNQNGAANPFSGSAFTVSPGDAISASVNYLNSTTTTTTTFGRHTTTTTYENFSLTITDTLATPVTIGGITETAESYTTIQQISGAQMSSAEWIEEAPSSSRGVLPLAPFGSVTFTNALATINGTSGSIASFVGNTSVINYGANGGPLQEINLMDMGTFNRFGQWTSIEDETSLLSDQNGTQATPAPNGPGDSFTVVQYASISTVNGVSTGPGGVVLYGPADRVTGPSDFQAAIPNAGTPAGSCPNLIVVEIAPAPPGAASTLNPVVANEAIVQPGFRPLFSQPEGALGRSGVFGAGMAVGEGHTGAGLSWFGLPSGSGAFVPPAATPVHGSAIAGGVRFESSAEPFGVASLFEEPAMAPASTPAFAEDAPIDRLLGALALIGFLPSQMPRAKEEPARARRLRDGNGRPE